MLLFVSNLVGTKLISCLVVVTIVHKQYKPYTLRIIYLINLFFLRIPVSRTAELFKKFAFLVFFALRKKHSGIKYFGKILAFVRYNPKGLHNPCNKGPRGPSLTKNKWGGGQTPA